MNAMKFPSRLTKSKTKQYFSADEARDVNIFQGFKSQTSFMTRDKSQMLFTNLISALPFHVLGLFSGERTPVEDGTRRLFSRMCFQAQQCNVIRLLCVEMLEERPLLCWHLLPC